jgi:hypothetical protein
MKHPNPIERVCLIFATVFILAGGLLIVHPMEANVVHPGMNYPVHGLDESPEHVTKKGARIFGVALVVIGGGLAWLVFYRPGD